MGKKMLQTCVKTEFLDLCDKLAKKFSLPKVEHESGETIFQGSTYRITHDPHGVNGEEIMYKDSIGRFSAFRMDKFLAYDIKSHYLNCRADTLRKTVLGTMIAVNLEALIDPSNSKQKRCELLVKLLYLDNKQLYKLIESHILD